MGETTPLLVDDGTTSEEHNQQPDLPPLTSLLTKTIITNSGSTARDHLANERTYLAWMRTSLAIIGVSIGLLKWDAFSNEAGIFVSVLGVVVLVVSTHRYYKVLRLLEQGQFAPNILGILIMVILIIVGVLAAFISHYIELNDAKNEN
jgi:putative membrane protein